MASETVAVTVEPLCWMLATLVDCWPMKKSPMQGAWPFPLLNVVTTSHTPVMLSADPRSVQGADHGGVESRAPRIEDTLTTGENRRVTLTTSAPRATAKSFFRRSPPRLDT